MVTVGVGVFDGLGGTTVRVTVGVELFAGVAVAVRLAAVAAPSGRKLECISGIRCGYIKARCAEHHTIERDLVLHFTDGFRMRGLM